MDDPRAEILSRLAGADRMLPGEDRDTDSLHEAFRWARIYGQLLEAKTAMLNALLEHMPGMEPECMEENFADQRLLLTQIESLQARLRLWNDREEELREGLRVVGPEGDGPGSG